MNSSSYCLSQPAFRDSKIKLKRVNVVGGDIDRYFKKRKNKEHWQTFPKTQIHEYVKVMPYKILAAAYQVD